MAVSGTLKKIFGVTMAASALMGLAVGCSPLTGTQSPTESQSTNAVQTTATVNTNMTAVAHAASQTPVQPSTQLTEPTAHSAVLTTVPHQTHPGIQVPILEYHDITYIPNDPWTMSPDQFSQEMQFLADHHFHPITLDQFYAAKVHGVKLPSRPVVITFDDGYDSNYTNAFPILQHYGFHATIFMISSFIGRHGFLSLQQMQSMQDSGLVAIESHTVHHKNLEKLTNAQALSELVQSRQALTLAMHHPVLYFCYPDGGYNENTLWDVRQAGYLLATTTDQGYASLSGNPYLLKRIAIHEDVSLGKFAQLLTPSLATQHV